VESGRQAYIICPMVEESENIEAENVIEYTEVLKSSLPSIKIEYLHGKMKPKEKNNIMERFAANDIQILVSTTVVEVGVNVPNATVMMIENAERFGLAQLHQLRGRVGRGKHQSYCILVNGSDSKASKNRLEILNKSNDGFFIASEDLKLRGPGDLFGFRQSGMLEFKIGDVFTDASILQNASEAAAVLLEMDQNLELPENELLKDKLDSYIKLGLNKLSL
jgi:ATP-dependent DNA helicase RecG